MSKDIIKDKEGIARAFNEIQVKVDLTELDQAYAGYKWYLIPHWRVKKVVYAVPAGGRMEDQPWESWYLDEGQETHHVHVASKVHEDDIAWIQEEWTEERPDEVIGRLWYWYDDPDMQPVLIQ